MLLFLVVVADFDSVRVPLLPAKADAAWVVYADAVLALPISVELLQAICRWHAQLVEARGGVQQQQLPMRAALNVGWQPTRPQPPKHLLGLGAREASNHRDNVD